MTTIDATDRQILAQLSERHGLGVGGLSEWLPASVGPRAHRSQWASSRLRRLEKAGLTARMDGDKPIAWVRTPAGTAAVEAA